MSDQEAVKSTLAGNREAFEDLVNRYSPALSALAYDRLGNVTETQDSVQDTFVTAFKKIKSLKNPEKFGPWIYEILRNECAKRVRRNGVSRRGHEEIARRRSGDAELSPLDHATHNERKEELRNAVHELSPVLREAVALRYVGGASRKEAAAVLDISIDALDKRLERALRELRTRMGGE